MTACRACGQNLVKFFSLGKMPLVNAFLRTDDIPKEKKFDLTVGFCPKCYLVQLMKTVDPKDLFQNYLYFSSATQSIVEHSEATAHHLMRKLDLNKKSLVVEVGSNDGVQLLAFKKNGVNVLGIDPAKNIAKVANERGIRTIPNFFNLALARTLEKADLVYGANVFAHVPAIIDFLSGIKLILKPKGTAVFEFPYIAGLFENKFDTIYHEHVFYYSATSVRNLVERVGLSLYDVERVPMQGGSLRVFISHQGVQKPTKALANIFRKEKSLGYDKLQTYQTIRMNVEKLKKSLILYLKKIRVQNKHIAAYGAPAKGIILLNYFHIQKYMDFIVDKSVAKQGLYTPGSHMRIYPVEKIYESKPDYLLVLCWNIIDEVKGDLKKYTGQFIHPLKGY